MREIKYRQKLKPEYCKNTEPFHYWGFIDGCFHSPCNPNSAINYEDSEQYTGLKDKNGVEIFEGDVLRILSFVDVNGKSNYLHHVIEWSDKFNGWFARNLKESGKGDGSLQLWVYAKEKKFEVVGSVHQSPELLEE